MTNLSTDICFKFKEARKAKGLNQSAVARALGCQQSAISMFEGGMTTKLSDELVHKLADFLGVTLPEAKDAESAEASESPHLHDAHVCVTHGYCPNGHCPSNIPYVVEGRLFYRPNRNVVSPTGGARCTQCGEVLELRCPSCGAPLNDGACCAVCGAAYVTPVLPEGMDVIAYAQARRAEISQLRTLGF